MLPSSSVSTANGSPASSTSSIANWASSDTITLAQKEELDRALAAAINHNCLPFNLLDKPEWAHFFKLLRPCYKPPSPLKFGTTFLDLDYDTTMKEMRERVIANGGGVVSLDGATNVISRGVSNFMVHNPLPWFIQYLPTNLQRQTAEVVADQVEDTVAQLVDWIKDDSCSFWAVMTDSCNAMRNTRRKLKARKLFRCEFGCCTHCVNNFVLDVLKLIRFKLLVKRAVLVSKTIKNTHLIRKLFDVLCREKLGRELTMVLYSSSRWSSCNFMFRRLNRTKTVIRMLPLTLLHEREERAIAEDYELPAEFAAIINKTDFWRDVSTAIEILDPLCKIIGILESDSAPLSLAYACFVYIGVRLSQEDLRFGLDADEASALLDKLHYRWSRIYSPAHALAFFAIRFSIK